ncbi:hypothetical protein [Marivirga sp.]|uniref:hypothetical protein n=1 Tax=Marivirga sp. TaxID=2018662 RepID=UPI003DA72067
MPVEDVLSQNGAEVILKDSARWFTGKSSRKTLNFKENQKTDRNGTVFAPVLEGSLPKITPELREKINAMYGKDFLLVYHDFNNYRWLVGSLESPLKFFADLETGDRPDSRNHFPFSFESPITRNPILPYNGEINTVEPTEPGETPCLPVTIKNILGETIYTAQPGSTITLDTDFGQDFIEIN